MFLLNAARIFGLILLMALAVPAARAGGPLHASPRSQRFADLIAGNDAIGTTTYPGVGLTRARALTLDAAPTSENGLFCGVIDPAGEFAYFGTNTVPGRIVKVRLSDLTRVGSLPLHGGENSLISAVIDSTGSFAYFGTATAPGIVVKVDLATFTRVGAVTLNTGENFLESAVIDPAGANAYFGTYTAPGIVVQVQLSDMTRVAAAPLNIGESNLLSAVIDATGTYAYFGTNTTPGRVAQVRLSDMSRVSALTLDPGENMLFCAAADPAAGFAYFGTYTSPGRVVKVQLSDLSRVGALPLDAGEELLSTAVLDAGGGFAYFGTGTAPGMVAKVRLADFTRVGSVTLNANEDDLESSMLDPVAGSLYFGTSSSPGIVVQVHLAEQAIKATRLTMPAKGALTAAHFYSHAAQGQVRLGIYEDGPTTRTLRWQSAATNNTVTGGWMDILISAGTPTAVTLDPGTYWLAWQTSATAPVASYAPGSPGTGFSLAQGFGAFPAAIAQAAATATSDTWSQYVTYAPVATPTPTPRPTPIAGTAGDVVSYLLGITTSSTGLDKNSDTFIDSGDVVWSVNHAPPLTPQVLSPVDNATSQSLTVKLRWQPAARASSYDLWLWQAVAARPNVPTTNSLIATSYQPPVALTPVTSYRWQVRARSADGVTTGPVWRFSTSH